MHSSLWTWVQRSRGRASGGHLRTEAFRLRRVAAIDCVLNDGLHVGGEAAAQDPLEVTRVYVLKRDAVGLVPERDPGGAVTPDDLAVVGEGIRRAVQAP